MNLLLMIFACDGTRAYSHQQKIHCSRYLIESTQGFIAYVGFLLDESLIGVDELEFFERELKSGKVINPISVIKKKTDPALHEPYEELQNYLEAGKLNLPILSDWIRRVLATEDKKRKSREAAEKETKDINQAMIFNPIPRGAFRMGEEGYGTLITLPRDIEMMSTKVTQKMWVALMGENPSHFKHDPDLPVEQFSFWSALHFLNRLSIKRGYKPAYNLSGIVWKPGTRAEDGTLSVDKEHLKEVNAILNRNNLSIYEAEGYRLPTDAEAEYVRKNLGKAKTNYLFGDSDEDLGKYAWFSSNSDYKTHPVAQKLPLVVNGNPFYDLYGLLWEWCWDSDKSEEVRSLRGGGWIYDSRYLRSEYREYASPNDRWDQAGIRPVRTLPLNQAK